MANTIDELKEIINSKIRPILALKGFRYRKSNNSFTKKGINENEFRINVKLTNGGFNIHLILAVYNNNIGSLRENIKKLTTKNENIFCTSKAMLSSFKKNNSLLADLTDWKSIDKRNELHIWFESFDDINKILDLDIQLNKSVEIGLKWFKQCEDFNYLIQYNINRGLENTIETSLLLLYYQNNIHQLDYIYNEIIMERNKRNLHISYIEDFYHALKRYIKQTS